MAIGGPNAESKRNNYSTRLSSYLKKAIRFIDCFFEKPALPIYSLRDF